MRYYEAAVSSEKLHYDHRIRSMAVERPIGGWYWEVDATPIRSATSRISVKVSELGAKDLACCKLRAMVAIMEIESLIDLFEERRHHGDDS